MSCVRFLLQVRLTLETVAPVNSAGADAAFEARRMKASPPVSQLVRLLWGEDTAELQMSIGHIPHVVMYLSLKLDSASPQDEVSFEKPLTSSSPLAFGDLRASSVFPSVFR